jgi:hypothetical protein
MKLKKYCYLPTLEEVKFAVVRLKIPGIQDQMDFMPNF